MIFQNHADAKTERGNYIRMNRTTEPWTQKNDDRKSVLVSGHCFDWCTS